MKKILFIDRDGTLIVEPPEDFQVDSLEKLEFYPGVFQWLSKIVNELEYELVMVTNQDGLGTKSFPEKDFWPAQKKVIQSFLNEGIKFRDVYIDKSFPEENKDTRKPGTAMLSKYIYGNYDLKNSFVIGDRISDIELSKNLGSKGIFIGNWNEDAEFSSKSWEEIYKFLKNTQRTSSIQRNTKETQISIELNLDGKGSANINTGIGFFDHMLEQIARHGNLDLKITAQGDLHIDPHHTIEDVGITLGQAFKKALGDKKGIERYGFLLPMDDCLAQVGLDFGGRPWLVWDVNFSVNEIGGIPTEMFSHFFKSFSDNALCNLNIKAEGGNNHHKIESVFKAFAKSIAMAIKKTGSNNLPTTKGLL